jgi:hypothetical protein
MRVGLTTIIYSSVIIFQGTKINKLERKKEEKKIQKKDTVAARENLEFTASEFMSTIIALRVLRSKNLCEQLSRVCYEFANWYKFSWTTSFRRIMITLCSHDSLTTRINIWFARKCTTVSAPGPQILISFRNRSNRFSSLTSAYIINCVRLHDYIKSIFNK